LNLRVRLERRDRASFTATSCRWVARDVCAGPAAQIKRRVEPAAVAGVGRGIDPPLEQERRLAPLLLLRAYPKTPDRGVR
jgi:hypothetical protein